MHKIVWIIHSNAFTPDMAGPTRSYDLAKELIANDFNPRIISSSFHYEKYIELKKYGKGETYFNEVIDHIHFTWIKTFPYRSNNYRRLLNWLDLSKKIYVLDKYFSERPEIIIGSSPNPFSALASFYLSRKLHIPFIFEFRDIWPDTLTEVFSLHTFHPLVLITDWIINKLYKEADHIISTLPLGEEKVLEKAPFRSRKDITWIPNGVDSPFFLEETSNKNELPKEFDYLKRGNKFKVVYAGSLGNAYRILSLIDVAKIAQRNTPKIHFTIVGSGAMKKEMEERSFEYGLENITFHEPIDKNLIPELLDSADLLYASLKEEPVFQYGMSLNKIQEYLLMAKPIVFACEICGRNPITISGAGRVANSSKVESIFNAILEIYKLNDKERKEMGKKGREYVIENFSIKRLGVKLTHVLNKTI